MVALNAIEPEGCAFHLLPGYGSLEMGLEGHR